MKIVFFIVLSVSAVNAAAYTGAACFRYVDEMVSLVMEAPECDDCVDETQTNEVEVLFPTMARVFEYGMPSNSSAYAWTASEREGALLECLRAASQTNATCASAEYQRVCSHALMIAAEKHYTNLLSCARSILYSNEAPCRDEALSYVIRLGEPSEALNSIVVMVQTNKLAFSESQRRRAISEYVQKVTSTYPPNAPALVDAARSLYRVRESIDHLRALDLLLQSTFAGYSESSNRLEVAERAMARAEEHSAFFKDMEKRYFGPLTNRLQNIAQPLPEVGGLRGL